MNKTRIYHGLAAAFGALVVAWGALQLSTGFTLLAALVAIAGLGMAGISSLALVRPDLDSTEEPATWKIAVLALGVVASGAGLAITATS